MILSQPKVFLHSYGCQMNLYDGELVTGLLARTGFHLTSHLDEADAILINTCSVRDHAEQRVLGRLRTIGTLKSRRPNLIIGVLGCMAQRRREELQELLPVVDLVLGPDAYRDLPQILHDQLSGLNGHGFFWAGNPEEIYSDVLPQRRPGVNALVAIMRGCDNFCSYCVVPYVRGRERSRNPEEIMREIEAAIAAGYLEVTLLGQNVNSYRWAGWDFPDLLERVARIAGLKRLRFLTSHPRDLSDKLIERMAAGGTLCPSLHLPVQSGADRILDLMGRGYTARHYLDKAEKLRAQVPGIALTTDLLCGFSTESEEDFQATLDLMQAAHFDDAFTYRYSVRPGTKAAAMPDDVPEEVKISRLERMITLSRQLADRSRQTRLGQTVEVLLESPSLKNEHDWTGRTRCGRMALVPGDFHPGEVVNIKVSEIRGFSLWGKITPKSLV